MTMKIALLQINTTVGDLQGNAAKIAEMARLAKGAEAVLAVTPELALPGYLPRDLLLNQSFVNRGWEVLGRLAEELKDGPAALIGLAQPNRASQGRPLFNAAALISKGKTGPIFHKKLLPTYDVFDEERYFEPGSGPQVLDLEGLKIGVSICEDVWNDKDFWQRPRYHTDPIELACQAGAQCLVNLSASPFRVGIGQLREEMLASLARRHGLSLLYANQVGGNDDLVFDGRSSAFDSQGRLIARGAGFKEDLVIVELNPPGGRIAEEDFSPEMEIWQALVTGTRDYAAKCGFKGVLVGLSGGVDSSLTAAVAAEAMGGENVVGVLMPSPYSSPGSLKDALALSQNLGLKTYNLPIEPIMRAFEETLAEPFTGLEPDVTEENIQARIRGSLLMALSNKFGHLVLTTGNKSELAVGYCTLYGDMCGGLAVIADVPKMMVYRLAEWLNRFKGREVIPSAVLTKSPSAELRPDQTDQDSLPPYQILDEILVRHLEKHESAQEIVDQGFDPETVRLILDLVKSAEFKRKQSAPGLKVTDRAFGTGWRMPIARKSWED
jgi:NAD+ synthase/NAD+ synthase (glutamine-hydrolysing)